jgi:hypothetical protein
MTIRTCTRLALLIALVAPLLIWSTGTAAARDGDESNGHDADGHSPITVVVPADCTPAAAFKAKDFPRRARVDNTFFPLRPGTNFVMSGTVVDEQGVAHQHDIVTTVTDLTKTINGVRSLIVFDRDLDNGELQESELAFMAQDEDSRVWNTGEYPEEYVDGKLDGAPSTWIAGIARATAGVGMLPKPRVGTAAYLQGFAPKVGFRDCAQVVQTDQKVCVPVNCYHHVLVTEEWAPLEPDGGHQLKYYAPGVGNIKVGAIGGTNPEVLQLTKLTRLNGKDLAAIDQQVLAQDRRGYRVSPNVYGHTPIAKCADCS